MFHIVSRAFSYFHQRGFYWFSYLRLDTRSHRLWMLHCGLRLAGLSPESGFLGTVVKPTLGVFVFPPLSFCGGVFGSKLPKQSSQTKLPSYPHGARLGYQITPPLFVTKGKRRPGRSLHLDVFVRTLLIRFLTRLWGQPVIVCLMRNLQLRLTDQELIFLFLQNQRIFVRMPGAVSTPRQLQSYAWRYGAVTLYLSVALRDPALLVMWLQNRLQHLTLFQHRRFFRTLVVSLRTAVLAPTCRFQLQGLYLQVTGKISVTGNAMSRTYLCRVGSQGNSNLTLRAATSFTLVRTKTGCLGLWLSFFF